MPTYRNVNSGQVVQRSDDPSDLDRLARWVRIEDGPSAPDTATEINALVEHVQANLDAVNAQPDEAAAPAEAETETPAEEPADEPLPLPSGTDREEWIAYALANGKTEDDIKGTRTRIIAGWFKPE